MNYRQITFVVCALFAVGSLSAQTSLNPDISVVGDFRLYSHNNAESPDESEKLNLANPSIELVASGYLNPYARADAVIAWHGEESAELEEAYATIERGLPLNMNLRIGKYLTEFGRLNPVHEHAWSFIKRPLPHTVMFGDHGLMDMSVRTSFLLPTGNAYTELMLGLLKGDALAGLHHHEDEDDGEEDHGHEETDEPRRDLGFFGRLTTSLATSDNSELALGGSVLNAVHAVHEHVVISPAPEPEPDQLRAWLAGIDLKYKYQPSRYTALQCEAEGILRSAEQSDGDKFESYGGYAYLDYRFRGKYNLGGIVEYTRVDEAELHGSEEDHEVHSADTWRAGLFAGFAPIEETSLVRLAGHWTEPDEGDGFWEVALQLVFSLGPHQPHNF